MTVASLLLNLPCYILKIQYINRSCTYKWKEEYLYFCGPPCCTLLLLWVSGEWISWVCILGWAEQTLDTKMQLILTMKCWWKFSCLPATCIHKGEVVFYSADLISLHGSIKSMIFLWPYLELWCQRHLCPFSRYV